MRAEWYSFIFFVLPHMGGQVKPIQSFGYTWAVKPTNHDVLQEQKITTTNRSWVAANDFMPCCFGGTCRAKGRDTTLGWTLVLLITIAITSTFFFDWRRLYLAIAKGPQNALEQNDRCYLLRHTRVRVGDPNV